MAGSRRPARCSLAGLSLGNVRPSLFLHYHSLKPNLRRRCLPVAGCQVARDVEVASAGGAGVDSRAAGDAEGDAVGVRGGADGRIGGQYEAITFDED